MSSLDETEDTVCFYTKLLDDLKNLELKLNDSDEANEGDNELSKLRRDLCISNNSKFYNDLSSETFSLKISEKSCKLVAELAKDEQCRNVLVEKDFFKPLNKLLTNPKSTDLVKTQVCRAIGNLCFYNDKARLEFNKTCGLQGLIDLCKYCTSLDYTIYSDEDKKEKNTLILVALGCLHNVTNENETLRKAAYDLNVMSILKDFIPFLNNEKGISIHFGSCIENLIEQDEGKAQFVEEKFALKLYEFLDEAFLSGLDEYSEDFLSILSSINDLDMSKDLLCQTEFLGIFLAFMESKADDEDLMRNCGLFLTNLLIKDDKIEVLFEYKENLILKKAIDWLYKFESEQLYVTSAVIIANYMRNDENASKIMQNKHEPHAIIINILRNYNKLGAAATLQQINVAHSLLATLRNFCIAVSSREELLKHDIIEVVLEFLNFENLEVKWKALGILRLLVKSCTEKTGLAIVFDSKTLGLIEEICGKKEEHPGVVGESSRLVCYLPIAAKSEKYMKKFCEFKFIDIVCAQLKSEHLIMLNEALLALNVLTTIDYKGCREQLRSSQLNDCLKDLLKRELLPIEMRSNVLKLFKFLFDRNDFLTKNELEDHLELIKCLILSNENQFLKSHLDKLITSIEDTLV